jgi:GNAT superfamily N-acetyltransferase
MRLRRAVPGDAARATQIVFEALRSFGITPDPTGLDADLAEFGAPKPGVDELVAEVDGRVVGLVALSEPAARVGWIGKLFVDAAYRGRGLGRALLADAVSRGRARGLTKLELRTRTIFTEAVHLYEREGWQRGPDLTGGGPDRTYFLLL